MDHIEHLISDARQELRRLSVPENKKEDFRLAEDHLRKAEIHYCKLKDCPRKIKSEWYTPPTL